MPNGNVSDKQKLCSIAVLDEITNKSRFLKEGDYILVDPFYIAGVEGIDSLQEANELLLELEIDSDESTFQIYEAFVTDDGEEILTILTNLGIKEIPARFCLCAEWRNKWSEFVKHYCFKKSHFITY